MSIRWIRNVMVDNEESSLEIQLGYKTIGDKCYTRIGEDMEEYFNPVAEHRQGILEEGKAILQQRLQGKAIIKLNGEPYDWE
jgi:uncharacterized protein (UPF0262 family)